MEEAIQEIRQLYRETKMQDPSPQFLRGAVVERHRRPGFTRREVVMYFIGFVCGCLVTLAGLGVL